MKKRRALSLLLTLFLVLSLLGCDQKQENNQSAETLVNPVDGLSWGMTQDEALAALPESCSFQNAYTIARRTYIDVDGFTGSLFGYAVDPTQDGFLKLEFLQPLSYEGVTHEPVLERLSARVACDDFDKLKEAVSDIMGKPFEEREGGSIDPSGMQKVDATVVWRPAGSGIQQYGEDVECLAAAMYGIYYGGNFPDGGDVTNLTQVEELGELNLKNAEEVRKLDAYDDFRAGQLVIYDCTQSDGFAILMLYGGLPVMAEAAESHLK